MGTVFPVFGMGRELNLQPTSLRVAAIELVLVHNQMWLEFSYFFKIFVVSISEVKTRLCHVNSRWTAALNIRYLTLFISAENLMMHCQRDENHLNSGLQKEESMKFAVISFLEVEQFTSSSTLFFSSKQDICQGHCLMMNPRGVSSQVLCTQLFCNACVFVSVLCLFFFFSSPLRILYAELVCRCNSLIGGTLSTLEGDCLQPGTRQKQKRPIWWKSGGLILLFSQPATLCFFFGFFVHLRVVPVHSKSV